MTDTESKSIVHLIHTIQSFGWRDISDEIGNTNMKMDQDGKLQLIDGTDDECKICYDFIYQGKLVDEEEVYHLWDSLLDAQGFLCGVKTFGKDTVCFYNWGFPEKKD
jgi:hypothetical protein